MPKIGLAETLHSTLLLLRDRHTNTAGYPASANQNLFENLPSTIGNPANLDWRFTSANLSKANTPNSPVTTLGKSIFDGTWSAIIERSQASSPILELKECIHPPEEISERLHAAMASEGHSCPHCRPQQGKI